MGSLADMRKAWNSNSKTNSFVENSDQGMWRGESRISGGAFAADNPAAHETGHLLGLDDRYTGGTPDKGWAGNIMAEGAGKGRVDQRNINTIMRRAFKLRDHNGVVEFRNKYE